MAEADITTIASTADGASGYGAAMRGAMATLQDRQTAAQVTSTVGAATADLGEIVHQNVGATGTRIFVRFTGDDAPTGLVKGDIVITQA